MTIPIVVLAVFAVAVLVAVVAAVVVSASGRVAGRRASEAVATERVQTVQAAVDAVLAVADGRLADQAASSSRELDLRTDAFGQHVDHVTHGLARLERLVADLQRERAEQHGRLEHGLAVAAKASTHLSETAQSLREALASTKVRGQWGERMADDVLRTAGFVEGVNYRKQVTVAGGGRPDFTFDLPHERVLHMDVKFPLDNYLRSLEADHDHDRDRFEVAFLKDVRERVKEISGRGYIDPDETIEAVLLFIPNESIYAFVHERDPQLVDVALAQKVVLCSPFTLFAVLAVVRQATDAFMLERTGDEILQCLAGFTSQWDKFSDAMDKVGKRLESTQSAYDEMAGPRRRQLQRHLDRIDALRAERGLPLDRDIDPVPEVGSEVGEGWVKDATRVSVCPGSM
jgi:DNA recombination protein RmuC